MLFVGVHMVGSSGGIKNERKWKNALLRGLEWTELRLNAAGRRAKVAVIFSHASPSRDHAPYFDGLAELAERSPERPFVYVHGDLHRWDWDERFKGGRILRVCVDRGGIMDPVRITIDLNGDDGPIVGYKRRNLTK